MNIGMFQRVAQWVAGLKSKSALALPQTQDPEAKPDYIFGTPGFNPNTPLQTPDTSGDIDAQLKALYGQASDSIAKLGKAPPKYDDGEPGGLESAIAAIGGLVNRNPYSAQKYADAPYILGQNRAKSANDYAQKNYELQQQATKAQLSGQIGLIGAAQDRDSVLQKVKQNIATAQINADAKTTAAALKADQGFRTKLVDVINQGGNQQSIAQLLMGMGQPTENANATATEIWNSMQTDPSFKVQLAQDAQSLKEQKANDASVKDLRASYFKAKPEDRPAIAAALRDAGDPSWQIPDDELMHRAGALTPTEQVKAEQVKNDQKKGVILGHQIAQLPEQDKLLLNKVAMSAAQLQLLDKRLANFDSEFRSKLAQRTASIARAGNPGAKQSAALLNGLASIYREQLKKLDAKQKQSILFEKPEMWTEEDDKRSSELHKEYDQLTQQYESAIQEAATEGTNSHPITGNIGGGSGVVHKPQPKAQPKFQLPKGVTVTRHAG